MISSKDNDHNETIEERLFTPVAGDYDVVVAGAGPAGVPAAIAAARTGAKTLLLEAGSCLGGVWTRGILTWVFDIEKTGIGNEIMSRLRSRDAFVEADGKGRVNFTYDIESMKLVLEQMCREEGIEVRLHTRVAGAHVNRETRRLEAVFTESKSGRQAWRAKTFVDATGDGDLGAQAGCSYDFGADESDEIQPLTFMGLIVVNDHEALERFISFYNGIYEHGKRWQAFRDYLADLGVDPSYAVPTLFQAKQNLLAIMVNHEYGVVSHDAEQITAATMRARAEVNEIVDALAGSKGPFRGAVLASTAEYIGVRDGRRIHGRYRVTTEDITNGARFEDAVCRVRFGVDVHASDRSVRDRKMQNAPRGIIAKPYDIPVGALIAKDVDGLLTAGRCISGDWYAHASYRVTGEAVSMGEAAGALAALAAASERMPHEVPWPEVKPHIPEIREYWTEGVV